MNKNIFMVLLLTFFFLTGCEHQTIEAFTNHSVVLANGIDFKNHQIVIVDAETSKEVANCDPTVELQSAIKLKPAQADKNPIVNKIPKCTSQFSLADSSTKKDELLKAIQLSKEPIEGVIRKENGETVPATYFVIVTALYKGSHCNTTSTGGSGGQKCGKK